MKLKLEDLKPAEASFSLSDKPGTIFVLKKFTLADQIWAKKTFGDRLATILEKVELEGIAELAFHLLKDKTQFKDFAEFAENIVTHDDKLAVLTGLLTTIGISQPVLDKLKKGDENPNE